MGNHFCGPLAPRISGSRTASSRQFRALGAQPVRPARTSATLRALPLWERRPSSRLRVVAARDDADIAAEAAALLRRVLEAVEHGDLDQGGPRGAALLRRLEGVLIALELVADVSF